MKISTRVRYGLKALVYIADKSSENKLVRIKEISDEQGISVQYLEQILFKLKNENIIENKHIGKLIVHFNKDIDFSEVLMKNYNFFKENNIRIKNVEKNLEEHKIEYTLIMGKQIDILDVMSELSTCNHISQVQIP